jgi:hypothetical protein
MRIKKQQSSKEEAGRSLKKNLRKARETISQVRVKIMIF